MNIEEYISTIPDNRKQRFQSLLQLIESLYPEAEASMRYKMPTYQLGEGSISIASQKHYISLYTCSAEHIAQFKNKHPKIKTGKGCINFKDSDEIPFDDLKPVVKSAMEYHH